MLHFTSCYTRPLRLTPDSVSCGPLALPPAPVLHGHLLAFLSHRRVTFTLIQSSGMCWDRSKTIAYILVGTASADL